MLSFFIFPLKNNVPSHSAAAQHYLIRGLILDGALGADGCSLYFFDISEASASYLASR